MATKKDRVIKLKLCSNKIKKPFRSRENIFAIYSPKKYPIPESDTCIIDTEIITNLPQNSTAFLTTKFKDQKIKELKGQLKKRLRIRLLNESYFKKYIVEKRHIAGYLLSKDSKILIQKYEKKKKTQDTCELPPEDLGLEELLEEIVHKLVAFSTVTISRTLDETLSTSSAKSHPALSKMQVDKSTRSRKKESNK